MSALVPLASIKRTCRIGARDRFEGFGFAFGECYHRVVYAAMPSTTFCTQPMCRAANYYSGFFFFFLLRRSSRRLRRFAPATLTAEPGLPTRASASVAVITVAGTTRLNAAAKPRSEKAPRREIISDLIFALITTSLVMYAALYGSAECFDRCLNTASLLQYDKLADVRYAPKSDRSRHPPELTRCANHCHRQALFDHHRPGRAVAHSGGGWHLGALAVSSHVSIGV